MSEYNYSKTQKIVNRNIEHEKYTCKGYGVIFRTWQPWFDEKTTSKKKVVMNKPIKKEYIPKIKTYKCPVCGFQILKGENHCMNCKYEITQSI